jgi:hypothetical protein
MKHADRKALSIFFRVFSALSSNTDNTPTSYPNEWDKCLTSMAGSSQPAATKYASDHLDAASVFQALVSTFLMFHHTF